MRIAIGEFAHGFATITKDKDAVAAALAHPGQVLRRPFGSHEDFAIDPKPPKAPRVSAKAKKARADAERARKAKAAAEARAEAKRAKKAREAELKQIDAEEAALKKRRAALEKGTPHARRH